LPLAIRVYECGKCGFVIGRDHNSAITIDRAGQARIYARGEGAVAHQRSGNARADLNRNRDAV
jgi:transposase